MHENPQPPMRLGIFDIFIRDKNLWLHKLYSYLKIADCWLIWGQACADRARAIISVSILQVADSAIEALRPMAATVIDG